MIYSLPAERTAFELLGSNADLGVVLVHGFRGDTREMRLLGDTINALGLYCYAPLLPGHGGPPHLLEAVTDQAMIGAVKEAIDKVRALHHRVIVCAFSMGGAIATCAIADDPVDGFIALAPMIQISTPVLPIAAALRHVIPWVYPLKVVPVDLFGIRDELLALDPSLDLDDPAVKARLRAEVRFPLGVVEELRKLAARARQAAPRITTPTLIVQGEADGTLSPEGAVKLYQLIASTDKALVLYPKAGHQLMRPGNPHQQELLRAVQEWIAERYLPADQFQE